VVEKLGFRSEGLRPRYLHIDGDWRDHLIFALNSDEVGDGMIKRWDLARAAQDHQAVPGPEPREAS
jgi:ribosomal-protein-alanine N-acetyltransferase